MGHCEGTVSASLCSLHQRGKTGSIRDSRRLKHGTDLSIRLLGDTACVGDDGEDVTLAEVVHEGDLARRNGNFQPNKLESRLLALDVTAAIRHLTPDTQKVARLMSSGTREWEIAAKLGISRRQVRHAMTTIRACLKAVAKESGQDLDQTAEITG